MDSKEDDVIIEFITASTHSDILFFSSKGKAYKTKMYELPEGKRTTKGKFIANFLPLEEGEEINSVIALAKDQKESADSLLLATKNGTVKKSAAKDFFEVRSSGLIAIKLKDGDSLIDARFISEEDNVILATEKGKAIHFKSNDLRQMGRVAEGVRGIKIKADDNVVSMSIVPVDQEETASMMVLTKNGYGKKTAVKDFKIQNRGGSGIKAVKITEKTGDLVGAKILFYEHTEVIAMSENSQVIRTTLDSVPMLKRDTQGVRIMRLNGDDQVTSFVRI